MKNKASENNYIIGTEYIGQVIKLHFEENVTTQVRKSIKADILKNNIGNIIVDMKTEYNLKAQKFELLPSDIIIILKRINLN